MAGNIVLKTYKGGTVTPQNDAIVQETAIPMNGIFRGCNISYARGSVLRVSQGFGMLKGRFFEIYDCEVDVQLAQKDERLYGRLYVHMDLSNADEPVQLLTAAAAELPELEADSDVNYNNSIYDMELATFRVTSSEVSRLEMTFQKISPGSGGSSGGGGRENILRSTQYSAGDMTRCASAPGWATFVCIQGGETAMTVPSGYPKIEKIGDTIVDGTCVFQARAVIDEIDGAKADIEGLRDEVDGILSRMSSSDGLAIKLMSLEEYAALEAYSDMAMYYCYYASDPGKIVRIYLGENKVYSDGVNVTYQTDTDESVTIHVDGMADALFSAPAAYKEGYDFVGWRKDTEADGRVSESCVVDGDEDFTLYAVFKRSMEITMYPSGGTLIEGKKETTLTADLFYNNGNTISSEVSIPECPYERKDMSFCGWSCEGKLYKPKTKGKFTDDAFIVPEWIDTVYDFPYTGSYVPFTIPADGIYEFEVWGAAGATARKNDVSAEGGKGGHAKGYKKMEKGEVIFIYNGGKPSGSRYGGSNSGGDGYTYSSGSHVGAGGGGATHVARKAGSIGGTNSNGLCYANRNDLLIVAGGGGGGIVGGTAPNKGGDGGGERGGDGSDGVLGGRQISTGSSESSGFGNGGEYSGSNMTSSGGGAGYFGEHYGSDGNSGAGGSGYVGGVAAFTYNKKYYPTINEAGVNEGNGYSFIHYVECI